MEKITKQEIEDFKRLYDKMDTLGDEIILYISEKRYIKYLTGYNDISDMFDLSICPQTLDMKVWNTNEYNDYVYLSIPWEHVQNDTWKEYLDEQVREDIEKENARKQREIENREKQEYEQYLKLKEKFGNK